MRTRGKRDKRERHDDGDRQKKRPLGDDRLDELVGPEKYIRDQPICIAGGTYELMEGATSSAEIYCTLHGSLEDIAAASAGPR